MKLRWMAGAGAVLVVTLAAVAPAAGQWVPKRVESDGSAIPRTPWGDP